MVIHKHRRASFRRKNKEAVSDPYFSNVILLLDFETSSFLDSSSKNKTPTLNLGVTNGEAKFGSYGGLFPGMYLGTGSQLRYGSDIDFSFGSGDFTIEMWIKPRVAKNYHILFDTAGSNNAGYLVAIDSARIPFVYFSAFYYGTTGSISLGTWQHLAVVRQSGTMKIYVNGIGSSGVALPANNAYSDVRIGVNASAADLQNFDGLMDELRITKGIARYTSNFTPPNTFFPV